MVMADLKTITFFIIFSFLFLGILGMIGADTNDIGEYQTPDSYNDTSLGVFDTLKNAMSISTGVWIIDQWAIPIFLGIISVIVYRALRGQ